MAPRTPQSLLVRPGNVSRTPSPVAIEAIEACLTVRPRFACGHADPAVLKIEKAIREHEKPIARDLLTLYAYRPREARLLGANVELWAQDGDDPRVLEFPESYQVETDEQGEADSAAARVLCGLRHGQRPTLDEIRAAKRELIEHRDALDDKIAAVHGLELHELYRSAPSTRRRA